MFSLSVRKPEPIIPPIVRWGSTREAGERADRCRRSEPGDAASSALTRGPSTAFRGPPPHRRWGGRDGVRRSVFFLFLRSSPVFDPSGGIELTRGRPASRRSCVSRRVRAGSRAKSEASLEAARTRWHAPPPATVDVPPCSGASRHAPLFALDPPCARRPTGSVGTQGVPSLSSTPPEGSNTGLYEEGRESLCVVVGRGEVTAVRAQTGVIMMLPKGSTVPRWRVSIRVVLSISTTMAGPLIPSPARSLARS